MNLILKFRILEKFGTQANFAAIQKVDESLVSRTVRGRRVLPKGDQIKWARALDCDVAEIFPPLQKIDLISPQPNQEETSNASDSGSFPG